MQSSVARCHSFRRLLEFRTIVAEIGDKPKKIGYQCGLRLAARLKSGGPSLGRSPARTSSVTPSSKDKSQSFGETGSTQFLSGASALLFFFEHRFSQSFVTSDMTAPAKP